MRRPDWGRLGLVANPFENVLPGEHLDWVDLPVPVLEAVRERPVRLELQGPKGAGKSTVLRALAAQLPDPHLRYLGPGDRLTPLPSGGIGTYLLDEADRAERSSLRRLIQDAVDRGLNVILGTHEPLVAALPGSWRQVDLAQQRNLGWIQRRVDSFRSGAGPVTVDFAGIGERFHGELGAVNYAIQRALYELAEDLARGATPSPEVEARSLQLAREELLGGRHG